MAKYGIRVLVCAALLLSLACDASNPVAPDDVGAPGGAGGSSGAANFVFEFADETGGEVIASDAQIYVLVVNVKDSSGNAAPDNTEIAFSTSLGNFGRDPATNNELKEVTYLLVGGVASVEWTPGTEVGVAQILVAVGNAVARRSIRVEAAPEIPIADFEFEVSGLIVLFSDASTGGAPTSWAWNFDDGSCPVAVECTEREPKHTYASSGTYGVTLRATNAAGSTTKRKLVVVGQPPEPPVASFESTPGNELQVIFSDTSTGPPTSWKWDFGDGCSADSGGGDDTGGDGGDGGDGGGDTGGDGGDGGDGGGDDTGGDDGGGDTGACVCTECTEQNPTHSYETKGQYLVTLEVSNQSGTNKTSAFVDVGASIPDLKADFDFAVSDSGLIVTFTDTTSGQPTQWNWDFGDGCAFDDTSECKDEENVPSTCPECTEQNPIHTFVTQGEYQVKLTVEDTGGITSTAQKLVAAGAPPPIADFDWTPKNEVGLRIVFEDLSQNNPTEWEWDFGDGCSFSDTSQCTDQDGNPSTCPECTATNPVHDYRFSGSYPVQLIVRTTGGEDDTTKLVEVDSGEVSPVAKFLAEKVGGRTVDFTDLSTGPPTSWEWNFDDPGSGVENTSTNQNPIHTFTTDKEDFQVSLKVSNGEGESEFKQFVRFTEPVADFSFRQDGWIGIFTDESLGTPVKWTWSFKDDTGAILDNGNAVTVITTAPGDTTFDYEPYGTGTYRVTLEIENADGETDSETKEIAITP